jgi:hypothetical protein
VTWRGDLDLQIWRVHMGQAVEQGAVIDAQAGDRLQWTIETNEAGWFAVYDVQEDGEVNVFTEPMELSAHSLIEGAVLLDDYAGSERLFFVLTDQPLRVVDVEIAVEEAWRSPIQDVDALPLDALTQRSVLVLK